MSNALGNYNEIFFAQESLIYLQKALGLANRVHRGYDAERSSFGRGDTINIRGPGVFAAQSAPGSAIDLAPQTVALTLNGWQEVRFSLTDKELAYTQEKIIEDHIMPAAYALADKVDTDLATLCIQIPHAFIELSAGTDLTLAGVAQTRRRLLDLKAPVTADPNNMHFMLGPQEEAIAIGLSSFAQWQGAGSVGVQTQIEGSLGRRLGFEFFTNQNRPTVVYGDITDATITGPTAAKGATSIAVAGGGASDPFKKGTILKFTSGAEIGNQYVTTTDVTLSSNAGTLVITPALKVGCASGDTISIGDTIATLQSSSSTILQDNVTNNVNLGFHKNFAALAFAKLPDFAAVPGQYGTRIMSVQDPISGLAVRCMMGHDINNSKLVIVLDVLYGYVLLNADLACRYEVKNS